MFYLNFKFLIVFMYPKLAYKQYFHSFLFIEIFLNHSFKLSFNSFLFLFSCSIFINTKPTNFCYFFFNFISIFRMYIYLPIYLAIIYLSAWYKLACSSMNLVLWFIDIILCLNILSDCLTA